MRIKVQQIQNDFLKSFPVFKRFLSRKENGDVFEETKELVGDEKEDKFRVGSSPDSFADAVSRVADTSMIDRFEAVERLNAAIAGIQFNPLNSDEK